VIKTQWKMMRVPLAGRVLYPDFTPDPILAPQQHTGLLTVQEPAWTNANLFLLDGIMQPGPWSFWQVTWFENALEFLDSPGEWYLDSNAGWLYYIPRPGEDLGTATVELAVLETLVQGHGSEREPVENVCFQGLTFTQATWLAPSGPDGYVADQSGFRVVGQGHPFNVYGHVQDVERTPGSLSFRFARNVTFQGNIVEHMGGVGLDFGTGSQGIKVQDNLFEDTSSSAIQLGGVGAVDHHPTLSSQVTRDNTIVNNLIRFTGRDYYDSAGIMVGFTENTLIQHNTIVHTPWSGIAVGWGWGLLDPGMFPGLPGATRGEWGVYLTPTASRNGRILNNRIHSFLNELWDGGSVYTTGAQGSSMDDALLIQGNVADHKRPMAGGNTFYTDGGSRYIIVQGNASFDNPQGVTDFGPAPQPDDPLPYPPYYLANGAPYGSDAGGCLTYGDIAFIGNYLVYGKFDAICAYPPGLSLTNLSQIGDVIIQGESDVPSQILLDAGVRERPSSIPPDRWILP
ncbi:MAG: right-handed parallel beta-helix repeat-containing protein, partial [Candidatus Eremiobacterota bacterium]